MKITSERLRQDSGYIGKIEYCNGVKYVQISKSPACGTIVCVGLDENDNPMIGWALINPNEPYVMTNAKNVLDGKPGISWEAAKRIATERAKAFANGKPADTNPHLPNHLKAQVEHFKERAQAYFKPEKYSRKDQRRPGQLLKVWVEDIDATADPDHTRNMTLPKDVK